MSSQPIKSFITIHNIDQITRLDSATNEQVVNSYQCTELVAGIIDALIDEARNGLVGFVVGERGVGKSHLLAFLRAILAQPELIQKIQHPFARKRLEQTVDSRSRSQTMVTINCDSEQTDITLLTTRGDAQIEAACSTGKNVFVFIDGISLLLRRSKRDECLQWLVSLVNNANSKRYQLFIALDQDLTELLSKTFSNVGAMIAIETLPVSNLAVVLDEFICPKKNDQRKALDNLYNELRQKVPSFQWSQQEFLQSFPLHPQVLKITPALRTYARTFSLFSFFYNVTPRTIMRRGFNLISLVEVFETFEYDLRRNGTLTYLFNTYDYLLDNFVKALPSTQQFQGKFLLRAITLLSLTEKPFTALQLADSVMVFDDSPAVLFCQSMKTIMDFIVTAAGEKMIVITEGVEKFFQLRLAEVSKVDPIEEALTQIEDDDSRLVEILIDSGKQVFKDWPLIFDKDNFQRRSELELTWRGTNRRGILKLGGSSELASQASKQKNFEWQLILIPLSSLNQQRSELSQNQIIRYWYPDELHTEESHLLKRLLIIRQQGQTFLNPEELKAEDTYLTTQVAKIFSRCYLETTFLGIAQKDTAQLFSSQEKRLPYLLGAMLDSVWKGKFSRHPVFSELLTERTIKVMARGFFFPSEWSRPELKKYLGLFALPLHIVSLVGENFEYALRSDIPIDAPLGKLLDILDRAYNNTISKTDLERLFYNEPFGLQQSTLLLLILGSAAAGHIILTDDSGEVILTNAGIRSGYDIANYTKICLPTVLQPKEIKESKEIKEEVVAASLPLKVESSLSNYPVIPPIKTESLKTESASSLEKPFPSVTGPLTNTGISKEKPSSSEEDELLEFYQSGFFPRPNIPNEPVIKASTTAELPNITRIRKNTITNMPAISEEIVNAEPKASPEEDELLEFYQSGMFPRPNLSSTETTEKSVEKAPIKLTSGFLKPLALATTSTDISAYPAIKAEVEPSNIPTINISPIEPIEDSLLSKLSKNTEPKEELKEAISITEDGKFDLNLELPPPPAKAVIDLESALASFEADRDRLANAPTLSELPIISDIPEEDSIANKPFSNGLGDYDDDWAESLQSLESLESLKETQKVPIVKITREDQLFEPISPSHPTVKLPTVPFSEDPENAPKLSEEQLKQFLSQTELNKITQKLPSVPSSLQEVTPANSLNAQTVAIDPINEANEANNETNNDVESVKTGNTPRLDEVDDIYLDPFTGVFETVTFPDEDEEEKQLYASIANKFATQGSIPSTSNNADIKPLETNVSDQEAKAVIQPANDLYIQNNLEESQQIENTQTATENPSLLIDNTVAMQKSESNNLAIEDSTQDSTQDSNVEAQPIVNNLIDVSLNLDELNNLMIAEQNLDLQQTISQPVSDFASTNISLDSSLDSSLNSSLANIENISSTSDITANYEASPTETNLDYGSFASSPTNENIFSQNSQVKNSALEPLTNNINNPITLNPILSVPEKTLGDLLLGNNNDFDLPKVVSPPDEPSPIEYVPDEFVFGERNFNVSNNPNPKEIKTLPSTTLAQESLPNEILLRESNSNHFAITNNASQSNIFPGDEIANEYGFDTIMDDGEAENLNMPNEEYAIEQRFAPPPSPPPAITGQKTFSSNLEAFVEESLQPQASTSPMVAQLSQNKLVLSRKLNNEVVAHKELVILYEKFMELCNSYKAPQNIPTEQQFKLIALNSVKMLKAESFSSDISCCLEIVEGEVHVYCQTNRTSLFQKRTPRQRLF
ncbi:MAG: hypothetical protein IPK14_07030 [Blastocatellia bacterium]|nr:hypothetical protein [Blastocatellia bacterium]